MRAEITKKGKLIFFMCKLLQFKQLPITRLSFDFQTPAGTIITVPVSLLDYIE